jgi:selenide,water dikinase
MKTLAQEVLVAILRGGADMAAEAGVPIVGGHTVDDDEPKYGLAVTGIVHPDRFLTAHGAQPGDRLLLTKPIGSGAVSTAVKADVAAHADVEQMVRWATTLNRSASEAMMACGAHAATDITGFGLLGHLVELCRASGVAARVQASAVPLLPGALGYVRDGSVPGGTRTNLEYVAGDVQLSPLLDEVARFLLADPQTSGGLLVSLPPSGVAAFKRSVGPFTPAVEIGEVVAGSPGRVTVDP